MQKIFIIFLSLTVAIFLIPGCLKKEEYNVTIIAFPKHHGVAIASDSLYPDSAFIKFNSTNLPGTSPGDYDKIVVGESGEDHVRIEGLKRGKYFIFMTGYDASDSVRVTGGIPYEISQTSGEINLDVPVVE